jgi:SAM-dependent methyltransferase
MSPGRKAAGRNFNAGGGRTVHGNWFELSPNDFLSRWYSEDYEANAYGSKAGSIQNWMHRSLERGFDGSCRFGQVLEVGANTGEHLDFVRHQYDSYVLTDIRDPLSPEDKDRLAQRGVTFRTADAQSLPFSENQFDRTVVTCVLHHVPEPEQALCELRRVTKAGGIVDIFLSSDPGLAFRLARWVGPYRSARLAGLGDVKRLVDARDHRNHVGALRRLVGHVFRKDLCLERSFPVSGLTWNSSLWHTYRILVRS